MSTEALDPDELCGLCGETRENHGDKNHQFSADGVLIPLKPRPDPRQQAPQERPKTLAADGPRVDLAFATLVEILAEKDLLTTADIIRIFRGVG